MAFVLEDRVVETANNPGQGDFELLGAVENNQTFVTGIGNGNTTRYLAIGAEGAEIGIAQVQAGSPDRLLRPGTVKNFDGTTTPVNFSGTVTVACIASVEDVLWLGENGDLPARGGRDLGTTGDPWRNLFLSGMAELGGVDIESNIAHPVTINRLGGGDEQRSLISFERDGIEIGRITGAPSSTLRFRGMLGQAISLAANGSEEHFRITTDGNAEAMGDMSVSGSLTLSGGLTTGGNIWVDSDAISIRSDSSKQLQFRDSTGTILGVLHLDQSNGQLILRVHNADGSWAHHLALHRDGRATFNGTLEVGGNQVATVSQATSDSATNFPVGHTVIARASNHFGRNSSQTVRLMPGTTQAYELQGTGTILSGTWRMRGTIAGGDGVVERTA